jgi:hypothetical protein
VIHGTFPRSHPNSPGPLPCARSEGSGLSLVDCWTSRMVSTSPRSRQRVMPKMSSRQWVWCRGVLTPSNLSVFIATYRVRFLQFLRAINSLQLLVDVDTSGAPPLDLSKAAKLKELSFRFGWSDVQRITMTLQTAQSKHLQQITIYPRGNFENPVEETVRLGWQDLDRLLVQFWTSHSIRPKIMHETGKGQAAWGLFAERLLPELSRRGLVDLATH